MQKNVDLFTNHIISYSNNVFINIKHLLSIADEDNKEAIWKHLLTISAVVITNNQEALSLLKKSNSSTNQGQEHNFLHEIIETVEKNIDVAESNPNDAISKMMSSGALNGVIGDMTKSMEDGNLDIGKLMNSYTRNGGKYYTT